MLEPNQTFRNYKELCAFLNEPVVDGNSKIRQLNRWREYFTYRKDKHKFIILTVMHNNIDSIPENSGHVDAVWSRHISVQLYHSLAVAATNPENFTNRYGLNKLVLSTQEAFEAVGFVNEDFKKLAWYDSPEESPTSSIIFYKAASNKLYDILNKVINTMHVRKVINVFDTYLVHTARGNKTLRLATVDEWGKIRAVCGELLATTYSHKSGKPGTLYSVNTRGLNKPFYKELSELLEPDEIFYSHKVYSISFLASNLQHYRKYLLHDTEVDLSKGIINTAAYEAIRRIVEDNLDYLPKEEDTRTIEDKMKRRPIDKTIYFELLEQTVPLTPSTDQAENSSEP